MDYLFTLASVIVLVLVPLTSYVIGYLHGIEKGCEKE